MIKKRLTSVFFILFILLLIGTLFYHQVERWGYLDSLYFSVTTITTIGYGDFAPKTDTGKIFTIFFAFSGIAVAFYTISVLMKYIYIIERRKKLTERSGVIKVK